MTPYRVLAYAPLLALLAWAAVQDVRTRRIRNWLTFSLAACGLAQSFAPNPTVAPGAAALGLLTGFALTVPLFAIGALGGGDVKLMAAIGAWLGPWPALQVFLGRAVVGMVIVLVQAGMAGRLRLLLRNTAVLAVQLLHLRELGVEHVEASGRTCRSIDRPLPFAVPVLATTLVVLYVYLR
jgi:prepilin peptidase CpaA